MRRVLALSTCALAITLAAAVRPAGAESGITISSVSAEQADNLAMLGRVWGFLKYHHRGVAGGELAWDEELFRVIPEVLEAPNRKRGNRILTRWVKRLRGAGACDDCAGPPQRPQLEPDLDWIGDAKLLSRGLSRRLTAIHANRWPGGAQTYVRATNLGHPDFAGERSYPEEGVETGVPDTGYRLLALFRLWNIIEYWFPYRDLLDEDWPTVLREFVPRLVEADDGDAYRLELMAFIARIGDTHANLWSDLQVRPPRGTCRWPAALRFIEGRPTVVAFTDEVQARAAGLQVGDVIDKIDGERIDGLIEEWLPYYAASNRSTQLRDLARTLPRGECGEVPVTIDRRGRSRRRTLTYLANTTQEPPYHDRPGDTLQLLSPDVAYLKLSTIRIANVDGYLEQIADTDGLVIDLRNYPNEFVVFALGERLVPELTQFARFTEMELANPGAWLWGPRVWLGSREPRYGGRIAILVDEITQSQAEYTTMAFRTAPGAVVVGSTTAGADGNVSTIPLPGGLQSLISGLGVFYPDQTPTQRVGILPDVYVEPTRQGIIDGRDEVLEEALRQILGPGAQETEVRRMAARP